MTETRRNDPCPCGSGKKFKRCCGMSNTTTSNSSSPTPPNGKRRILIQNRSVPDWLQRATEYESLIAEMDEVLDKKLNTIRRLRPGSYRNETNSIMIDTSLPFVRVALINFHELRHARFGQDHYGEMLRRLDALGQLLIIPLNALRYSIITAAYQKRFGEVKNRIELTHAVRNNDRLLDDIRDDLASESAFMQGAHLLNDIEKRKHLLMRHWKVVQEGAAHWLGLRDFDHYFAEIHEDKTDKLEAINLSLAERNKLLKATDENGRGYKMAQDIAEVWGGSWIALIAEVCLCPDISRISILNASLTQIKSALETSRLSPDVRFREIHQLAISKSFIPIETESAVAELYRRLDPGNPQPPLTVDRFNEYWNTVDSDPLWVSTMERLMSRIGVTDKFKPIHMLPGIGGAAKGEIFATAVDKQGHIIYESHPSNAKDRPSPNKIPGVRHDLSAQKELFLKTMKREGLLS